jgi:uncharacterized protein
MVSSLAGERYISLTTFKRDGTPVSTPVWVTSDDGRRLLVWSATKAWKVRRLRRDARVLVAPSNFRGRERGRRLGGRARLIPDPASIGSCGGSTAGRSAPWISSTAGRSRSPGR